MTVAAYHRLIELGELDNRIELIEGFLVEKMSKSALHTFVVRALCNALSNFGDFGGLLVRKEDPLTLDTSEPEPDVCVVSGQESDYASHHPNTALLVAEVAVSSLTIDRLKGDGYARAGIPEYWLIRPEDEIIDVYREPSPDGYRSHFTVEAGAQLPSVALPGFSIKLADLLPQPE